MSEALNERAGRKARILVLGLHKKDRRRPRIAVVTLIELLQARDSRLPRPAHSGAKPMREHNITDMQCAVVREFEEI